MITAWIAIGGAAGSVARHLVTTWVQERGDEGFPTGTLLVNVAGSFLLAMLTASTGRLELPDPLRLGLATGLFGGFTTYSTFNHDVLRMLQRGEVGSAAFYVAVTLAGALAAGLVGWQAAHHLLRP